MKNHGHILISDKFGPDIQYHINSVAPYSDYGSFFHKMFAFEGDWWTSFYGPHYSQDAVTILPIVLHPKSRGRLWLQSSSPDDPPFIDPKYFSHPADVQTMITAIKTILAMIEITPELKKFAFELPTLPVLPMCQNLSSSHSGQILTTILILWVFSCRKVWWFLLIF